jgi:hypothetical protein
MCNKKIWRIVFSKENFDALKTKLLQKKSPNQETGLGNRGHLKVVNDAKLVLNKHE